LAGFSAAAGAATQPIVRRPKRRLIRSERRQASYDEEVPADGGRSFRLTRDEELAAGLTRIAAERAKRRSSARTAAGGGR
jgi:hypothetical protein